MNPANYHTVITETPPAVITDVEQHLDWLQLLNNAPIYVHPMLYRRELNRFKAGRVLYRMKGSGKIQRKIAGGDDY